MRRTQLFANIPKACTTVEAPLWLHAAFFGGVEDSTVGSMPVADERFHYNSTFTGGVFHMKILACRPRICQLGPSCLGVGPSWRMQTALLTLLASTRLGLIQVSQAVNCSFHVLVMQVGWNLSCILFVAEYGSFNQNAVDSSGVECTV